MNFQEYFFEAEGKEVEKDFEEEQLKKGTKTESEHSDLWKLISDWAEEKEIDAPMTAEEFYKHIAQAHVKEIPDYYDRLDKMETEAKEGEGEIEEDGSSPITQSRIMASEDGDGGAVEFGAGF